MDGDGRQRDEENGKQPHVLLFLVLLISIVNLILAIVNYTFDFGILLNYLGSAVSSISPGYNSKTRLQVALRLMQVAVLYFAVLVAAFRFMDSSDRFSVKQDRPLFLMVWLALLFVSVSAFLSVVSSFKLFTEPSFVGALLSMAAGFLVSVLTPVLALISESRGHGGRSTESSTEQTESCQHETGYDGATRDADGRGGGTVHGHSAGLRREREG